MVLRPYQVAASEALLSAPDGSLAEIPTGGGKSLVIGSVCRGIRGRVLLLAHTGHLIRQNANATESITGEEVGVYCAGLGEKELFRRITSATLASLVALIRKGEKDPPLYYDTIIIDEAHHVPPPSTRGGMTYIQVINRIREANRDVRVLGLTATPYRMTTGSICDDGNIFKQVVHRTTLGELLAAGWLCPLKQAEAPISLSRGFKGGGVGGESDLKDAGEILFPHTEAIVAAILAEGRKKGVIYACSIAHAEELAGEIRRKGQTAAVVSHKTKVKDYWRIVKDFTFGDIRYVVNMSKWGEGIDIPAIDLVALVRPSESKGFVYQACGRAMRLSPAKTDACIMDFGENFARHGPLNLFAGGPAREKGEGGGVVRPSLPATAPQLATTYDLSERPSTAPIMGNEHAPVPCGVFSWRACEYAKVRADGTKSVTLHVRYQTTKGAFSQYLSFGEKSHPYAVKKTREWWSRMGVDVAFPESVGAAEKVWGRLPKPSVIVLCIPTKEILSVRWATAITNP